MPILIGTYLKCPLSSGAYLSQKETRKNQKSCGAINKRKRVYPRGRWISLPTFKDPYQGWDGWRNWNNGSLQASGEECGWVKRGVKWSRKSCWGIWKKSAKRTPPELSRQRNTESEIWSSGERAKGAALAGKFRETAQDIASRDLVEDDDNEAWAWWAQYCYSD